MLGLLQKEPEILNNLFMTSEAHLWSLSINWIWSTGHLWTLKSHLESCCTLQKWQVWHWIMVYGIAGQCSFISQRRNSDYKFTSLHHHVRIFYCVALKDTLELTKEPFLCSKIGQQPTLHKAVSLIPVMLRGLHGLLTLVSLAFSREDSWKNICMKSM